MCIAKEELPKVLSPKLPKVQELPKKGLTASRQKISVDIASVSNYGRQAGIKKKERRKMGQEMEEGGTTTTNA